MKIIDEIKELMLTADEFIAVKGFYYTDHKCEASADTKLVRVRMEHTIKDLRTNDIIHIGACQYCKKAFYNSTYETHTL